MSSGKSTDFPSLLSRPVRALLVEAWLIMCKNSRENLYLLIVGNALFIQGFGAPPEKHPFTIAPVGVKKRPYGHDRILTTISANDTGLFLTATAPKFANQ